MNEPHPQPPHDTPEELGFVLPAPAATSKLKVLAFVLLLGGGALAFGYARRNDPANAPIGSEQTGTVKVQVIKPKALSSDRALELPGTVKALEETKIYPHTAGYVKRWLVDIGDKVTEGQLLAEIEIPDVDAQLAQARAQVLQAEAAVKQAKAQATYSTSNAARNQVMLDQSLVAKGTVEQAQAQAGADQATIVADEANVVAQQANVKRLVELTSFSKITAPFAGRITSRAIERGQLVGDTTTASTASPIYTLAATDPVRVFVDMPQTVATSVVPGTAAIVTTREYADRKFPGNVTRSAGALDPDLHTMTTEIQVPNSDDALMPGMYVQAQVTLSVPHRVVEIPATALYNDASGVRVATVDAQHKIHFVKIVIERDTGATLWIGGGLTGDEKIVKIAVPSLIEGDVVDVAETPDPAAGSGSASAAKK